jgi:hypothetical protein
MDNALCGAGYPNQGITYTYPLITSAASNAIKAVIGLETHDIQLARRTTIALPLPMALMLARLGSHARPT